MEEHLQATKPLSLELSSSRMSTGSAQLVETPSAKMAVIKDKILEQIILGSIGLHRFSCFLQVAEQGKFRFRTSSRQPYTDKENFPGWSLSSVSRLTSLQTPLEVCLDD